MDDDTPLTGPRRPAGTLSKAGRFLMQVLWPAFLMAIVGVGVLFSLVDPMDVHAVVAYLGDSREAAYTVGFLVLWVLFIASSGLTYLLAHGSHRER